MDSLRLRTARGLLWSGFQRFGGQAISLAVFVLLSRLLDPSELGLAALAYVYLTLAQVFLEQGLGAAIIQRPNLEPEHIDSGFWWSTGLGVALTALTILVAEPLANLLGEPGLAPVLVGMSPALLLAGLRIPQMALLQRSFRFRELATRTILSEIAGGIIGVALALRGFGVWALVGQTLGRSATATVFLWRVVIWRPGLRFSWKHMRDLIGVGLPVLGDRLLDFARGKLDDLLVGAVLGVAALGYYSVGYRLLNFLTDLIVGTVQTVALPLYSRLGGQGRALHKPYLEMNRLLAFLAVPVFLGTALMAPVIIPVVFGPQWIPSVPVMQILGLVGLLRIVPAGVSPVLTALGKPSINFYVNLGATIAATTGFLLVVENGIIPVALVHLFVAIFLLPVTTVILRRILALPIGPFLKSFGPALLGALPMTIVLLAVRWWSGGWPSTLIGVVLLAAVGGVIYLAATRLAAPDLYRQARQSILEAIHIPRSEGVQATPEEEW